MRTKDVRGQPAIRCHCGDQPPPFLLSAFAISAFSPCREPLLHHFCTTFCAFAERFPLFSRVFDQELRHVGQASSLTVTGASLPRVQVLAFSRTSGRQDAALTVRLEA